MVRIFAHRGYHINNIAQNSLQSLNLAFENNFHGIEFDIHYIDNKLIISHDKPGQSNMENLNNFDEFLKYKDKMLYWLDFKNLQYLSDQDLTAALNCVNKSIKDSKCDLNQFYFAPYITDFTIAKKIYSKITEIISPNAKIMAVCDEIEPKDYQDFYRKLSEQNIKYLSIKHDLINQDLIDALKGVEIFAWTVNKSEDALRLTQNLSVKNFTTDSITPKEFLKHGK